MNNRNTFGAGSLGLDDAYGTADLRSLVEDLLRRAPNDQVGDRCVRQQLDTRLWRALDDAGLTTLTSAPEFGAGPAELAVVLYGLARHAANVPIAETDLMAGWLARVAGHECPDGLLAIAIAEGEVSGGRARGVAIDAPWTREAAAAVLAMPTPGRLHVAIVDNDDVDTRQRHNLAGEPRNSLSFELPATRFSVLGGKVGDELVLRGAWARCVGVVGALDAAAEQSLAYTNGRVQFGRALHNFQSVQHALAAMVGEIERSRAAVALAVAAAADYGFAAERTRYATAVAKVVLGQTVSVVTAIAHQLHGAIGVTIEHPLWRSTMRAQSWVSEFGSAGHYARMLGRIVLGAEKPWDVMTIGQGWL